MSEIKMPQAVRGMTDGTIVRWVKQAGEQVAQGETIAIIDTENARIEAQTAHEGKLTKIIAPQGTTVKVDEPIAILEEDKSAMASDNKEKKETQKSAEIAQTAQPSGEVTPVVMPQAGNTMEEGTIIKWHVKPGDQINKGDIIFEAETDKAVVEIEATDSGRLAKIVVGEDQTAAVKEPVAYLAENDADVEAYLAQQGGGEAKEPKEEKPQAPAQEQTQQEVTEQQQAAAPAAVAQTDTAGRMKASPAARRQASQNGVDLGSVGQGRGPGGRILSTDVQAAQQAGKAAPQVQAPPPAAGEVKRIRMSQMRKAIGRNLQVSKQTIPHFYMRVTIDADPLMDFYRREKAKYRCSLNDIIVATCAKLLGEFPAFRTRLEDDELVEYPGANIGVAVGKDEGLVVPVIVGADQMNLQQLASNTKRIVDGARNGKIEGMGKGMFTISNLGMFEVDEFAAIINPPEAAILAVSSVREDVIVSGGTIRAGRVMTMTLSCDHRIVDGLAAAKFASRLKEILECPAQLL